MDGARGAGKDHMVLLHFKKTQRHIWKTKETSLVSLDKVENYENMQNPGGNPSGIIEA